MRTLLVSILPAAALVPIASTIIAVALPAIMADLDLGTAAVWWLVTGYLLLVATLQTPAGWLGDRLGQRRLLLAGTVLLGAASAGAAAAPDPRTLIVARLLQGAAGAAVVPSGLALIRRQVADEVRGRAVSRFIATMAAGGVIGVAAGGIVVSAGGWPAAFVALTVLSALTLPPQWVGRRAEPARTAAEGTPPSPKPWRTVMVPAAGVALVNLSFYVVLLVVPLRLDAEGFSTVASGLLLGAFILASAAGALTAVRVGAWIGRRRCLRVGAGAAAVALLGPALLPKTTTLLASCLILAGVGLGVLLATLFTVGLDRARRENAGAISGLLSTARYAGSITGTAALPPLLAAGGPATGLLLAAGAAALLTALPVSPGTRRRPVTPTRCDGRASGR